MNDHKLIPTKLRDFTARGSNFLFSCTEPLLQAASSAAFFLRMFHVRKLSCANAQVEHGFKADFHSAFFLARATFFLLFSELPCGMKWKTIQFKQ